MKKITINTLAIALLLAMAAPVATFAEVGYGGGNNIPALNSFGGGFGGGSTFGGGSSGGRGGSNGGTQFGTSGTTGTTGHTGTVLGASTYSFSGPISRGASGDSVTQLQERLRSEGFFTFPTSTGFFGPYTLAAVKAYQRAHGIPATGYVGPLTLAALNG